MKLVEEVLIVVFGYVDCDVCFGDEYVCCDYVGD